MPFQAVTCTSILEVTFILFEVEEVNPSGYYEVTDPEEEMLLLSALEGEQASLSKEKYWHSFLGVISQ